MPSAGQMDEQRIIHNTDGDVGVLPERESGGFLERTLRVTCCFEQVCCSWAAALSNPIILGVITVVWHGSVKMCSDETISPFIDLIFDIKVWSSKRDRSSVFLYWKCLWCEFLCYNKTRYSRCQLESCDGHFQSKWFIEKIIKTWWIQAVDHVGHLCKQLIVTHIFSFLRMNQKQNKINILTITVDDDGRNVFVRRTQIFCFPSCGPGKADLQLQDVNVVCGSTYWQAENNLNILWGEATWCWWEIRAVLTAAAVLFVFSQCYSPKSIFWGGK